MTRIEKLYWLTDKKNGIGIPFNVIARFCHCHPTSIPHYLEGNQPTERMANYIDQGIEEIVKILKEKLGEEE